MTVHLVAEKPPACREGRPGQSERDCTSRPHLQNRNQHLLHYRVQRTREMLGKVAAAQAGLAASQQQLLQRVSMFERWADALEATVRHFAPNEAAFVAHLDDELLKRGIQAQRGGEEEQQPDDVEG